MKLGEIIRTRRKELGWTQDDLAAQCGLARNQISVYEKGVHAPTWSIAMRILDALDLEISVRRRKV